MKKTNSLKLLMSLCYSFLFVMLLLTPAMSVSAETEPQKAEFVLTFKDQLISLHAEEANFKDILKDLENKAGVKSTIFEGVPDHKVTLDIKALPVYALDTLLEKMQIKRYAVLFEKGGLIAYILPEGKDISEFTKGKSVIKKAGFGLKKDINRVKGREIATLTRGKNNVPIRYVKDEILLKFHLGVTKDEISTILKKYNVNPLEDENLSKIGFVKARIPDGRDPVELSKEISKEYKVKIPEPNYISNTLTVSDPLYSQQWYVPDTNFDKAWTVTKNKTTIKVAVIDSGINVQHPDLKGKIIAGYDFVNNRSEAFDDNGHGTFVAGIVAATANDIGIKGLYDYARIISVKVIDQNGYGTYEDTAKGIIFAADNGAKVINMSIGGYGYSFMLQDAVDYALEKGCIVVAAGGNDGIEQEIYPAAYPDVIGVAALGYNGQIWSGSNSGRHIDVAAPGVDIISDGLGEDYVYASGTSASAPMVSALAAMIVSERSDISSSVIERLIMQSAKDLGEKGRDKIFGGGEIDSLAALEQKVKPFHDVAVRSVHVEPMVFEKGNPTYIVANAENAGTYKSEEFDVVLYEIVGEEKKEIGKKEGITVIDKTKVNFEWKPERVKENINFEVTVIAENDSNNSNNKKQSYVFNIKENNGLYVLYEVSPQAVHQWVALQSYNKLLSSSLKTEIANYLPTNPDAYWTNIFGTNYYYYGTNFMSSNDWDSNSKSPSSDQSTALIEGAWEEDKDDYGIGVGNDSFCRHFWEPTNNYDYGLTAYGNTWPVCGFTQNHSALYQAQYWWGQALTAYSNNTPDDKKRAYYYLGRVVHLLADMSVPAHVLDDPHPSFDNYERYVKGTTSAWTTGVFKRITSASANTSIPTPVDSTYYAPGYDKKLVDLFYKLAEKANDYDSDDRNGKVDAGKYNHWARMNHLQTAKNVAKVEQTSFWGTFIKTMLQGTDYEIDKYTSTQLGIPMTVHDIYFYQTFYSSIGLTDKVKVTYTDNTTESFLDLLSVGTQIVPSSVLEGRHQVQLEANAIGYVASLYQLFWDKTHASLTITKSGSGSGTVTSSPSGISCGTSCSSQSYEFAKNQSVTLSASPTSGSTFAGWSNACLSCVTNTNCNVSMDAAKTCGAMFTQNQTPTLTVTYPNGGETLQKGQNHTIRWTSTTNVTGNVLIHLYKGGTFYQTIAASTPNTGSYPFNPPSSYANGSDYSIGISAMSGTVSDFSNTNFSISDGANPYVTNRQYGSNPGTNIYVTFSKDMNTATFTTSTVTVKGSSSGTHSCSFTFAHPYELTINPASDFSFGETVTVTIGTGVKDLYGNGLMSPYTFSFGIEAAPGPTPTSISVTETLSPSTAAAYSAVTVSGTANYNTAATVLAGTATITAGGNTWTATVSNGSYSRAITAPGSSGYVEVYVSDGTLTSSTVKQYLTISGDQGGTGYNLSATYTIYDVDWNTNQWWYKSAFRTTDELVSGLVHFEDVYRGLGVKWEYYYPNGNQYGSTLQWDNAVPSPQSYGYDWWDWYGTEWGYYISGNSMAYNPGRYRIKYYVNDGGGYDYKKSDYYTVAWDFTEHRMAKDVQGADPFMPINETNTFYQTDTKAVTWANFDMVAQSGEVKHKFYEPNGSLYSETTPYVMTDPGSPHSWYSWYRVWGWIWINGDQAANKTGDWRAECYVKNPTSGAWDLYYTDTFRILENPMINPSVSVGSSPSSPLEGNNINLNISSSDNTLLKKVILYWNDGVWKNQVFDNIYGSTYSNSVSIGSFVYGKTIEYYAIAYDTSGNSADSIHQSFVVGDSDTAGPSITGVSVVPSGDDGDGIIEDNEQVKISANITDVSGVSSVEIRIDDTLYLIQQSGSSYFILAGQLATGTYNFLLTAIDSDTPSATNSYSGFFTVADDDNTPPTFSDFAPSAVLLDTSFTVSVKITDLSGTYDDPTGSTGQGVYLLWDTANDLSNGHEIQMNGVGNIFTAVQPITGQPAGTKIYYKVIAYDNDYDNSSQSDRRLGVSGIQTIEVKGLPDIKVTPMSINFDLSGGGALSAATNNSKAQQDNLRNSVVRSQAEKHDNNGSGKSKFAADRIIVKLRSNLPEFQASQEGSISTGIPSLEELIKRHSVSKIRGILKADATVKRDAKKDKSGVERIYIFEVPQGADLIKAIEDFSSDPSVEYAEPDFIANVSMIPNDAQFSTQWALNNTGQSGGKVDADIDASEGWDIGTGGSEIIVGVVDTGIDNSHQDLAGKVLAGYDFVNSDNDPADDNGHGTHVAGITAANTNNNIGISGVNWNARLLPVKVLGQDGKGYYSWIINGIIYAADNGAKVINLSLSGSDYSQALQDAVDYTYVNGSLVVAAMGNDDVETPQYPAACNNVTAVGATDNLDRRVTGVGWGSNYGAHIDVVAPGRNIMSTVPSNGYASWSGTSMATPHVVGVAALVYSINSNFGSNEVMNIILESADDMVGDPSEDKSGWDEYYGWGRLNARRAIEYALSLSEVNYKPVTIQNIGLDDLVISSITSPQEPFSIVTDNCSGKSLAPNNYCIVNVGFAPLIYGPFASTFPVRSNDTDTPEVVVTLNGVGADAGAPVTSVFPAGGLYGSQQSVSLVCDDDNGSGCFKTYYCFGEGCNPTIEYGSSIIIGETTDMRFYSIDKSGNVEETKTDIYVIDMTAPTVDIGSASVAITKVGPVTFTLTYTGADTVNLANGHVTLNKTGSANGTVAVSGSGTTTRTVTISGITGDGTLGISIAAGTASDTAGNAAAASGASATFTVDNTAPTDGTLTATPGNQQITLNWTAATESGTGLSIITPYKLFRAQGSTAPVNCSGTPIYQAVELTFLDTGLTSGQPYSYRLCAYDNAGNGTSGATVTAMPIVSAYTISFSFTGSGAMTCTPTTVSSGGSFECILSAGSGYHLEKLLDNSDDVTVQVSGTHYTVTNVSADHIVKATFKKNPNVLRLWGDTEPYFSAGYSSIQEAYLASNKADDILIQNLDFYENLNFYYDIFIIITGGYDADFNSVTGFTTIHGTMTIRKGKVIIDNLILK